MSDLLLQQYKTVSIRQTHNTHRFMFSSFFLSLSFGKRYSKTVTIIYLENVVLTPFGVAKHKFCTWHLLSCCFLYNVLIS